MHIYSLIFFLGPRNVKESPYESRYVHDCTYKLCSSAECRCEIKRGSSLFRYLQNLPRVWPELLSDIRERQTG